MTQAIQLWECKKCQHQWANRRKTKRQGIKPHVCPKCKSYLWDEGVITNEI